MPLLVLLFIVLPIAELYVIIKVGGAIGVLPTIALLILDSFLGAALLRHQGRAAWQRFRAALAENRVPATEVFDGAMIILGGAFLLTPGFISDVFGLLLLLPPTRAGIRRMATRTALARVAFGPRMVVWGAGRARDRHAGGGAAGPAGGPGTGGGPEPGTGPDPRGPRPGDIEGTGWEVGDQPGPDDEPPRLPR
jgi:UPF0716 protein FxsA